MELTGHSSYAIGDERQGLGSGHDVVGVLIHALYDFIKSESPISEASQCTFTN